MGVMLSCGGAVRWARDVLFHGRPYDEMAADAKAVTPGSEGLTFLPYLAGERCPHVDPSARGAFAGLALAHGKGHLARAVFEGVTFGMADCLETVRTLGGRSERLRVTGGGAKSAFWLQMMADVTETECVTMGVDEGPAFGAAILAGVGSGVWPDVVSAARTVVREVESIRPGRTAYVDAYKRYKALYPALKDWVGADYTIK
jgi:xylulokinase